MKKLALLLCLVFSACGGQAPADSVSEAEKCDPRNPDTCVGGPTSTPCGHRHQICCGINGWTYDCLGSDVCNPALYECVAQWVPCTVKCYYNLQFLYKNFQISGNADTSTVANNALWYCLQTPGASYISYSCTY